ncbi:hypothetical protein [Streptomyces sp. NPDC058385]|uniref:hypothetical protein n=1 Tax=Streptomyces sp. NPDC058385 TaxID=3346473 RepID=UPI00364C54F5
MSSRKLITAARVVTGSGGRCAEDGAVLTDGDTVVAAGRRTEAEALADERDERDERIELPGTTVLPGLVDAHVHLVFDAGTDPARTLEGQDDEAPRRPPTRWAPAAARDSSPRGVRPT